MHPRRLNIDAAAGVSGRLRLGAEPAGGEVGTG